MKINGYWLTTKPNQIKELETFRNSVMEAGAKSSMQSSATKWNYLSCSYPLITGNTVNNPILNKNIATIYDFITIFTTGGKEKKYLESIMKKYWHVPENFKIFEDDIEIKKSLEVNNYIKKLTKNHPILKILAQPSMNLDTALKAIQNGTFNFKTGEIMKKSTIKR